jgi:hypothetical protein
MDRRVKSGDDAVTVVTPCDDLDPAMSPSLIVPKRIIPLPYKPLCSHENYG